MNIMKKSVNKVWKKKILANIFAITLTAVALSAWGTGGGSDSGTPTITSPTVTKSQGIEFCIIGEDWTQTDAESKVNLAMSHLSAQSLDLYEKYAALEAELRKNNNHSDELLFVNGMNRSDKLISDNFINNQNVNTTKSYVKGSVNDLISAMEGSDLIDARMEAFQLLHYMEQRKYGSAEEQAAQQEELRILYKDIKFYSNGDVLPENNAAAIKMLTNDLKSSIPKRVGPYGNDILQQIEDTAQFDAWTEDLQVKGFNLTALPRSVARAPGNQQPRRKLEPAVRRCMLFR